MRSLMGFIALLIVVLALTKLPQHRKPVAFAAFAVLVVAMGIIVWLLR